MIYFTADPHFGDDRLHLLRRPFSTPIENAETIVRNFQKINDDDTLYVVGDVVAKGKEDWLPYIGKIKGHKTLIRGNHDVNLSDTELYKYFEQIIPDGEGIDVEGYNVVHYPWRGKIAKFNIVGHIHGAWRVQLNMLNVGVDANHFMPLSINDIKFYEEAVTKHYDEDVFAAYIQNNEEHRGKRGKKGTYCEAL